MPWASREHGVMIVMGGADGPHDQAEDPREDAGPESDDENQCCGHRLKSRRFVVRATIIGAKW
jgi:hypothetical protein